MERSETVTKTIVPGSAQTAPYVDWAAILAGAVIATALASLAVPFGAALGLSAISAERGEGSFDVGVILTGLWLVISTMASYLVGGYVAGRMRRRGDTASTDEIMARDGVNGLVVWGLGILVTAWMAAGALGTAATTAGQAVGGAASGVVEAAGNALGAAAQGAAATLDDDDGNAAMDWIGDQLLRPDLAQGTPAVAEPAATTDRRELARQSAAILARTAATGQITEPDRLWLVAATSRLTGLSRPEAETRANEAITAAQSLRSDMQRKAEEAEVKARDAAETARIGTILTAFILTAAALAAAAASTAGAVRGGRHRDQGRFYSGFSYRV